MGKKTISTSNAVLGVYAPDQQQLNASALISFNQPIGSGYQINPVDEHVVSPVYMPGVAAMYLHPSVGLIEGKVSDAAQIAALKNFSIVRKFNAGSTNYEPVDLQLYYLAVADIYSLVSFMRRAYGVMNHYDPRNRYTPDTLFRAMGLDYSDFVRHQADFYAFIQRYIARANALWVPKSVPIFAHKAMLFDAIYKDNEHDRSQYYLFTPAAFYKYSGFTSNTGGELISTAFVNRHQIEVGTLKGYSELMDYAEALLSALLDDQDIATMAGDVAKAYSDTGCFRLQSFPQEYVVQVTFNCNAATIFENATLVCGTTFNSVFSEEMYQEIGYGITQNSGILVTKPTATANVSSAQFANFHVHLPEAKDVMLSTRLMINTRVNYEDLETYIYTCGTEVPVSCLFMAFENGSNKTLYISPAVQTTMPEQTLTYDLVAALIKYSCMPKIQRISGGIDTDDGISVGNVVFMADNPVLIEENVLRKCHELAVLTLLGMFQ